MKRYTLKKDLPFAKVGEIIKSKILDDGKEYLFWGEIKVEEIENFDEWFEKIKEPEKIFTIDNFNVKVREKFKIYYSESEIKNLEKLGLSFETKEEAEKYLEYLKAKAIIKQDTKGFKPDWNSREKLKFWGCWASDEGEPRYDYSSLNKTSTIYFGSAWAIEESFKKHPEEWKTYLTYEQ